MSAAKAFVSNGASVVVVGRNAESAEKAKAELGAKAVAISEDATNISTAANAIETCIKTFGDFDALYHVAGGSGRKMGDGPLHEITPEGWSKTLELNLTSLMYSNQSAVKSLLN